MELRLRLSLPRDRITVPVVRRLFSGSMKVLGVDADCRSDVELAITEACANVLEHAQADDDYEVVCSIEDDLCRIEVRDRGVGFDPAAHMPDLHAESGRGLLLMRALVDSVRFVPRDDGGGVVVELVKQLSFEPGAPGAEMVDS